ncbi:hypothetical protein L915_05764 [Phytophthora nicotianae]|uniref:Uncharacterized protein n=1 Tax=Phytophthora nicotianae TaxID=4792 RepID=W2NNL8_PHYNI|nr:hypothetical protein L915_05764 [Phytophthora nicotianae]ETM50212.1 hypothetical protein L914_05706 [Phytophthora nicotianae]
MDSLRLGYAKRWSVIRSPSRPLHFARECPPKKRHVSLLPPRYQSGPQE